MILLHISTSCQMSTQIVFQARRVVDLVQSRLISFNPISESSQLIHLQHLQHLQPTLHTSLLNPENIEEIVVPEIQSSLIMAWKSLKFNLKNLGIDLCQEFSNKMLCPAQDQLKCQIISIIALSFFIYFEMLQFLSRALINLILFEMDS